MKKAFGKGKNGYRKWMPEVLLNQKLLQNTGASYY
jgi:hypothetical protein